MLRLRPFHKPTMAVQPFFVWLPLMRCMPKVKFSVLVRVPAFPWYRYLYLQHLNNFRFILTFKVTVPTITSRYRPTYQVEVQFCLSYCHLITSHPFGWRLQEIVHTLNSNGQMAQRSSACFESKRALTKVQASESIDGQGVIRGQQQHQQQWTRACVHWAPVSSKYVYEKCVCACECLDSIGDSYS